MPTWSRWLTHAVPPVVGDAVRPQRLGEDRFDALAGVQAGERVLEDHLHVLADAPAAPRRGARPRRRRRRSPSPRSPGTGAAWPGPAWTCRSRTPTRPRVLPSSISRSTPSTAFTAPTLRLSTIPERIGKCTRGPARRPTRSCLHRFRSHRVRQRVVAPQAVPCVLQRRGRGGAPRSGCRSGGRRRSPRSRGSSGFGEPGIGRNGARAASRAGGCSPAGHRCRGVAASRRGGSGSWTPRSGRST